ncbi:MAG: M55 family metallopeptidase [Gemmatimonadetes bacterium]|nr:M55 family metallopeptidase [Gemmatimonadota bacterium]
MATTFARFVLTLGLVLPSLGAAQLPPYREVTLPRPTGFRVYIVPDMEGMGSVIMGSEVGGPVGTESDYWRNYRSLLTQEVNAVIAGARRSGARDFVVNEGHGANRWASTVPWELDTAAILIRGWPKPIAMMVAVDSTVGTVMVTGAHANAGSPGVLSHHFVFDTFVVNGKRLNEAATYALIAGEVGVAVSLVAGDDVFVQETKEMLGNVIGVITKQAISRNAALTWSPARVRQMLADSAAVAVRRAMAKEFKPFTLSKPYRVDYALRASYPDSVARMIDAVKFQGIERLGGRSYRFTTNEAKQIGYLLDALEHPLVR